MEKSEIQIAEITDQMAQITVCPTMLERLKVAALLLAEAEKKNEKLNEQVEQLKSRIEYLEEQLNCAKNLAKDFVYDWI